MKLCDVNPEAENFVLKCPHCKQKLHEILRIQD